MGKRQDNLCKLLQSTSQIEKPTFNDYKNSIYYKNLLEIYKKLNGKQEEIAFHISKYDCAYNGIIVELDEENHFNRYRVITLENPIYNQNTTMRKDDYLNFSSLFENECCTHGKYWNTSSSDRLFGSSDPNGLFLKKGSSRWRQRAFYDLLKDHIPFILKIPVIRLSIYECLNYNGHLITINEILTSGDIKYKNIILNRIQKFVNS
jgi:hypothetical protein